jgi:dipeptidyl aminopeptidase/acylaminoacyl peptidase
MTLRALEARGVPTGLMVYPDEGHGFRKPANQRDAAWRTLAWFLEHLPPKKPPSPPMRGPGMSTMRA